MARDRDYLGDRRTRLSKKSDRGASNIVEVQVRPLFRY